MLQLNKHYPQPTHKQATKQHNKLKQTQKLTNSTNNQASKPTSNTHTKQSTHKQNLIQKQSLNNTNIKSQIHFKSNKTSNHQNKEQTPYIQVTTIHSINQTQKKQ